MFDEIYLRLLADVMPKEIRPGPLDFDRLLTRFHAGSLSTSPYGLLVSRCYQHNPDSAIGLLFGKHLYPATLCDLSRVLLTSEHTAHMLSLLERYHFTHGTSYYPSVEITETCWSIALSYPFEAHAHAYKRRFCAEAVFYYFINCFNQLLNTTVKPVEVCFDFPAPNYTAHYSDWGCPVYFNQPLAMIRFSTDFLNRPFRTSNSILHRLYISKCVDSWRKSPRVQKLEQRIVSLMMQDHPAYFHSNVVADKLNISVRGLQKRLNKHGESFSHLSHYARRELSKIYLFQKGETPDSTADKLGFQSASGFRRFFKQEFRQTPGEYLRNL